MIKITAGMFSLLLFVIPRGEQSDHASVGGHVRDRDHRPIAGATVSFRNVFTGDVSVTTSDPGGVYVMDGLAKGRYSAMAMAEGYGCIWKPNVFLYSGEYARIDFVLPRLRFEVQSESCAAPPSSGP